MKRLCIIAARKGSKRLPGKNVKTLIDKPLIFYTIDHALGLFDKIIITSDCENILKLVRDKYKEYLIQNKTIIEFNKRPIELATDTSKVIETVSYYYDKNKEYDQIWLLSPTCPLRGKKDIKEMQKKLDNNIDGIISITEFDFPPSLGLLNGDRGNLIPYHYSDPWRNGNSRSQDHPTVYKPNGSIYGMWSEKFNTFRNFYKGTIIGHYMSLNKSIDIDTEIDFKMAELLLNEKNNK